MINRFGPKDYHTLDEYIQVGRIGLLKAIRNYNEKYALSTLAWICIYREILQHVIKEQKHKCLRLDKDILIQTNDLLWELIPSSLTKEECLIIQMRRSGHTFKEIGENLSKTKDWAGRHYHQIIEKIKKAND